MRHKLSTTSIDAVLLRRAPKVERPRARLARALFPLLILTLILLPGFAHGALCPPWLENCHGQTQLDVPDCSTPPGLTTPPVAPRPLQALPDPVVRATTGGQLLPGMGSVSATGEYQYRIPIDVPAGRAGVQPSLSLVYGSRGRNGHVGVGWQLEGLSEINRCASTFATEGYADGVSFDATDAFCLDGHKLIAVKGSYGGQQTEYRTEDDIYAQIVSYQSKDQVSRFLVRTKDGRIRSYAPPVPAAPPAPGQPTPPDVVVSWPLEQEADRSGNSIAYRYLGHRTLHTPKPGNNFAYEAVEYWPTQIDYTRSAGSPQTPGPRSVRFEYEDRTDKSIAYVHSEPFATTKRLKSILLDAPNPSASELVWRYDLSYEPGSSSGRSRLTQVQRCSVQHDGNKGGCLDAKRFTWNQDLPGPTYSKEAFDTGAEQAGANLVGDFNGDGRAEIFNIYSRRIRFTADPAHPLAEVRDVSGLIAGTDLRNARLVDLYGDGRTRIIAPLNNHYLVLELDYTASSSGNVADIQCELSYVAFLLGEDAGPYGLWPLHVADLNGDGLPDLIKAEPTLGDYFWNWHYRLNAPQVASPLTWAFGPPQASPLQDPPSVAGDPSSGENTSFSSDSGSHRAALFPAQRSLGLGGAYIEFAGFGLARGGTPYLADQSGLPHGFRSTGSFDESFTAFADTDGDGTRNPVGCQGNMIGLEGQPWKEIDWQGLDHANLQEWRIEVADLDANGQDEVLLVHTTGEQKVFLFQVNAAGVVEQRDAPFTAPLAIGDFDGDGLLDIAARNVSGYSVTTVYRQTGTGTTDRIVAVNNVGDPGDKDPEAREAIVYSNAPFASGGATCTYPQRCMREGFAVVREHDVYQGADVQASSAPRRRYFYNYEDPRFDVRGRGFLGFGTVRRWDADRGAETTTIYDNATADDNGIHLVYPGALRPKSVLQVVPIEVTGHPKYPDARLSKTKYAYSLVRLNQGTTYAVNPATWNTVEWEEAVTIGYGDAAAVHITGIHGTSEKDALRQRLGVYAYDEFGNELYAKSETVNGVTTRTVSMYTNDTVNWLLGQLKSTDVTTNEDGTSPPAPRHKDYEYDARGLLCHVYTEKNDSNPEIPQLVTFTHDSEGLVTAVTTSVKTRPARTVHVAYESTERVYPSETWNDLGQASWTLFDPARGVPLASEDANGLQVHYRYDDLGRMVGALPEGQSAVKLSYEPRTTESGAIVGQSIYTALATGSASRSDRDLLGRSIGSGHKGFDGTWNEEATRYDLLGRVVNVTRPGEEKPSTHVTSSTYDNLDRPLLQTLPGGGTVGYHHSFSTSKRWDSFTSRETVRDRDGRVIQSIEDAIATRLTTSFTYGSFNQIDHVTDPGGNQVAFIYDQRGRRTSISDPDAGTTVFHYDGFGDVVSKTANGEVSTYLYDQLGRLTQMNQDGEWTLNLWDAHGAGRLAHTISPDGVEQVFQYNAFGQTERLTYTVDGESFEFKTTYDAAGRVINLAYPEVAGQPQRFSIGRTYNPSGYLKAVYDPASITYAPYWRVDGRNAEDRLTSVAFGDHTTGARTYFPETGRLESMTEGDAVALDYTYYLDGSLRRRLDHLAARDERFDYDAFHRLSTWNLNKNPQVGYHYDDLGNLTELSSKAMPWSDSTVQETNEYGTNGKPHALTKGPQGGYTYDARGRQVTAPGRSLVTYTERDLPSKITVLGGADTLFTYDASGARVKKRGPSETVLTLGGLYERRTKDGHHQHVFYVPGGDDGPVAQIVVEQSAGVSAAKTVYLHHDPLLGSVAAVTESSGALGDSFYYEPFGRRTDALGKALANGALDLFSGFTGHEHDDDLGLINMRGRIYDPTIRRFLSADPHVTDPLLGQSYNRYSYVVNDPTNLVDPTGFDWWDFGGGSWISSDGCLGQECGAGNGFSSSGFSFGFGGYSGSPSTGTPSGTSGSAVAGGGYGVPVQASEKRRQMSMPTGPAAPSGTISGPVGQAWLADSWLFHFNDHASTWIAEDESEQRQTGAGGAPPALMGGSHPIAGMIPILGLAVSVPSDTSAAPADVGAAAASISGLTMLRAPVPRGGYGVWGGRTFDLSAAGGPVRSLSTDGARITAGGIDVVEGHLSRFGPDAANEGMILRLRDIAAGKVSPAQVDLNFYTHELREFVRYRQLGFRTGAGSNYELWNNAHSATLADYGLVEGPGVLYHPSVAP